MSISYSVAAFLLFSQLLSFDVFAQDNGPKQTVENAQKFLSIVLPGKVYISSSVQAEIDKRSAIPGSSDRLSISFTEPTVITKAEPLRHCWQNLRYAFPEKSLMVVKSGYDEMRRLVSETDFKGEWGLDSGAHWGEVLEVSRTNSIVYIRWAGSKRPSEIVLGADQLAKRVEYAIDFLRLSL